MLLNISTKLVPKKRPGPFFLAAYLNHYCQIKTGLTAPIRHSKDKVFYFLSLRTPVAQSSTINKKCKHNPTTLYMC